MLATPERGPEGSSAEAFSLAGNAGSGAPSGSRTAAVVVHYGDPRVTESLVRSLGDHAPGADVTIVDNGGLGDAPGGIDALATVRVLRPGGNLGYGVACNLGAEGRLREFLLFLNNDVRLLPGTVGMLEKALDDDQGAAVVGPRILDPDGSVVPSITRAPSPRRILLENLFLPRILPGIPFFEGHHTVRTSHRRARRVECLLGAAFLIRREVFQSLAGFDRRYFFYCEESDLFRRVGDAGWRILFEPAAEAVHEGGVASRSVDRERLDRILHHSFLLYAERFHGPGGAARTRRALQLGAWLRLAVASLHPGEVGRFRRHRYRRILEMHATPGTL